jgi:hypothetical protein
MKQYRKIDIYNDGKYICTTTQSKTCREAIERFYQKPVYQGMRNDGTIGTIIILHPGKVTAYYQA